MSTAYFDCFSGISGDMVLGALVDAGLPEDVLHATVERLGLADLCSLNISRVRRRGMSGVRVEVHAHEHHPPHRGPAEIAEILDRADLDESVRQQSHRLFRRLAEVEAAIHHTTVEEIHFHELGALDTIVDVVGALSGLQALGVTRAYASPIVLGRGTVMTRHGRLPVPAPATLSLLGDFDVRFGGGDVELATPTGAALLWATAQPGPPPGPVRVQRVGYGAGARDLEMPNLLRLIIAEDADAKADNASDTDLFEHDEVGVLETQVDDTDPQLLGALYPRLLSSGALDLTITPIQMKKGRPGFALSLLVPPAEIARFARMLMEETTTIGVRVRREWRLKARRQLQEVETPYGTVVVKLSWLGDHLVQTAPEFEDCAALAAEHGVSVRRVLEAAELAARRLED